MQASPPAVEWRTSAGLVPYLEALAAMDANPPLVTVPLPGGESKTIAVDEVLAMNALFINLYLPGGYGKVPFLAYELRDGHYDQLAPTLAMHFLNSGTARVMHFGMVCSDDPVASLDDVDVTGVPEMYKGVIYDDATSYATFCPRLNLPQLPASSDELPVSDIPALLLQGGLDPATPVEGGNKLVAGLSNNYNVIFPSGAHVQASHSPCALSIFDAFLTDPTTAPDTSCVDPALSFAVPGPVSASSADGQAVITMTLPAGFTAGPQPNQWNDGAMIIALDAFETGTSAADALAKPLGAIQLPEAEPVDGPMIAGYPSLTTQVVLDFNGIPQHIDRFAFTDKDRAYRVLVVMTNPATLDKVRQTLMPEVLESITISGASNPASGSAAPSESGFSEAWEAVSCDTFDVPATVADISDCGYVTVPEFHNQPDGPTIQVAVVRTRSSSDTPAPDPLFMEQGGPGGSTIDIYPTVAMAVLPNMKTLLNTRDLVFVEQRGTRHSKPSLLCPEQTAANVATLQGVQDKDDVTFLQACYARLQAEGVNFDAFNTVQNAADMYAVAEALGYNEFSYYGVSYGTLLGQYVIAQAKEHPVKLRSAIIDAVVAPDVDFNAKPGDTASYALRNIFAGCAQDEICNRDFPNLESVFLGLVDQLNRQPLTLTVTVPEDVRAIVPDAPATIEATVTGEEFADVTFHHLYSKDKGRILPRHIYAAAKNNDFSWVAQGLADGLMSNSATGMYFTMLCSRQNSVTNAGDFFGAPYPQLTFKDDDSDFFQGCRIFDVEPEGDAFTFADNSTPTLILNGANDPITPQPYGEYVGSLLDTAYVYTFPGMGHGAILDSPCAVAIAVTFLADPAQGPDSSCLSSLKPVFYGYPTPLEQLTLVTTTLPSSVTLALPSQWTLGSSNLYTDPSDPASFTTGGILVAFAAGKSPAEAAALLGSNFKEIARDQVIGSHTWTVLEGVQPGFVVNRVAVAADEAAGGTVLVQISAAPATAEAVFAKLWEPILSSVKVGAATK
ncbi:MAG: alpha/beta fold hydrolase [Anaerolineales bacterium]|nr:alpha/beta fold hydrolase [Anaerolineales bacterium]